MVGVPAGVQGDQQHLCSAGTQVQSLVQHGGLRIWPCCSYGVGHHSGLDLIPGLGIPYAVEQPKKEKKKKKKEEWKMEPGIFHSREGPANISTSFTFRIWLPLLTQSCNEAGLGLHSNEYNFHPRKPPEGKLHHQSTIVWLWNELFLGVFLLEWGGMGRRRYK